MKKSWQEKMEDKKDTPKILKLEENFPCYNAAHKMGAEAGENIVLVNPREVLELMAIVPKGKLVTLTDICLKLAKAYQVKACCTLTAGIFTMTAANAAEEMLAEGKENGLPYWRTLKAGGELNPKYPGGIKRHGELLEKEGFTVIYKGKRTFIKDYDKYIYKY